MKQEKIKTGMVFTFGVRTDLEYVVISLHKDGVMTERITYRSEDSNWCMSGYNLFEHSKTKHIRTMDGNELSCYQMEDPVCNLEKGIYKVKQNIDILQHQPAVREHEVISILELNWDDCKEYQAEQYKLNVIYQQFGKEKDKRLAFHAQEKMACIRWFWDNFHKININQ